MYIKMKHLITVGWIFHREFYHLRTKQELSYLDILELNVDVLKEAKQNHNREMTALMKYDEIV